MSRLLLSCALLMGLASACIEAPTLSPPNESALAIGESREVTLEALRLEVSGFEQVLTRADLLSLPQSIRRELWLYDLDLRGEAGQLRLIDHALAAIRSKDPNDPSLGVPERNMVRLLNMSPANADLSGTPMASLLSLAPQVGIAAPEVLAESLGVEVDAPFLGGEALAGALVDGVISTHPNARTRPAPVSEAHPQGTAPVPKGHLPITLEDVATGLETLPSVFGPVNTPGEVHPGFISGATKADLLEPHFHMVVRANANALPFKGLDLSHGAIGSVTSIGAEAAPLFDFDDPEWLRIVGVVEKPAVAEMRFSLVEAPGFVKAGNSPLPAPHGNGPVWQLPPWAFERVVADAGLRAFRERTWQRAWALGQDPKPLFTMAIDKGWMQLSSKGDIGTPPPPLTVWDLMTLVAQTRLHDPATPGGAPIPEGQASLDFTLRDIPVGVTHDQINRAIRANLEADPTGLITVASEVLDQRSGAPDLYYVRPRWDAPAAEQGDWLFFALPEDRLAPQPSWPTPGFFADGLLTQPAHSQQAVQGDTAHLKVRVAPGQTLFCADDQGAVYRIDVLPKPSQARVRLRLTRLR